MEQSTAIVAVSPHARKSLSTRPLHLAAIRTPRHVVIGTVVEEDGRRIFIRRVQEKHVFRELDGWTLGAFALEQCRRWRVELLRYLSPDGVYETTLAYFIERSIPLEFPGHSEVQHVLPRGWWPVQPVRPAQRQENSIQEQLALTSAEEVST